MEQEKIIGKIKKCLALAKSDNPHEAAAGMRQALIQTFASPEGSKKMIEHYVSKNHPNLGTGKAKDRVTGKNITNNDFYNGREESKNAKLHHGVAGAHYDVRLLA